MNLFEEREQLHEEIERLVQRIAKLYKRIEEIDDVLDNTQQDAQSDL